MLQDAPPFWNFLTVVRGPAVLEAEPGDGKGAAKLAGPQAEAEEPDEAAFIVELFNSRLQEEAIKRYKPGSTNV
jgi:hypothetical protein